MVSPSNPRLMTRILDTISNLQDGKGSYVRDILSYLRRSYSNAPRNLTMQVQRALNHAVSAGILRHQSGRYKVLFTLNPTPSKAKAVKNSEPDSSSNRSHNAIIKSDGKATKEKSTRQRKEKTSSKQVIVARVRRERSKERNEKGLKREPSKRTQRKSNESKEKSRFTHHSGVDAWKLRKKQRPKKVNTNKSKERQRHQRHSSCSEEATDSESEQKVPRKNGKRSEKGRASSAPTRATSRESQQISKEISTSRKSIHEVGPVDSVESQPHLLLEPKKSTENLLEQRVSDEHVTIDDNNAALQDPEQDYRSNRSESGSTL